MLRLSLVICASRTQQIAKQQLCRPTSWQHRTSHRLSPHATTQQHKHLRHLQLDGPAKVSASVGQNARDASASARNGYVSRAAGSQVAKQAALPKSQSHVLWLCKAQRSLNLIHVALRRSQMQQSPHSPVFYKASATPKAQAFPLAHLGLPRLHHPMI